MLDPMRELCGACGRSYGSHFGQVCPNLGDGRRWQPTGRMAPATPPAAPPTPAPPATVLDPQDHQAVIQELQRLQGLVGNQRGWRSCETTSPPLDVPLLVRGWADNRQAPQGQPQAWWYSVLVCEEDEDLELGWWEVDSVQDGDVRARDQWEAHPPREYMRFQP